MLRDEKGTLGIRHIKVQVFMKSRCLCEKVEFEYDPIRPLMGNCHCEACRRSAGSEFVTSLFIIPSSHKIIKGNDFIQEYNHTPRIGRVFCKLCGSRLWNYGKTENGSIHNAPFANVTASSVVGDIGLKPKAHMHLSEKAEWSVVNDDLDKFDGMPPMEYFEEKIEQYKSSK